MDSSNVIISNRVEDLRSLGPFTFPSFHGFGQNFTLYLNQNHHLLSSSFIVERETSSVHVDDVFKRTDELQEGRKSCSYVGKVKGYVNSSVAVNVCNGLV